MKYVKSNVFTVLNAEEIKVGSKGYFAYNLSVLKNAVLHEDNGMFGEVIKILADVAPYRFGIKDAEARYGEYAVFYPVEGPGERGQGPVRSNKMKYDESNVCGIMDTKDVKVGSVGYFADTPYRLRERVSNQDMQYFGTLTCIKLEEDPSCFVKDDISNWLLFYPVDNIKDIPLTMNTVSRLCGKGCYSSDDTYTLLACCADKIVEATKLYAKWAYDPDPVYLSENKSVFTRALVDLVCQCGKIACREDINLDKELTARLFNGKQEAKVEKN